MTAMRVLAINGPTASGKSALAVRLAKALADTVPVEIVNADSMLVYRGMDIGTAKPTLAERDGVPHHLIDIMDITSEASVADFQSLAREAIAECQSRGVLPIVVGGSALYMRAILDEFDFPGTDPQIRARWEERLAQVGAAALHAQLAEMAPEAAVSILPGNARRIVRALEVVELTGSFTATIPEPKYALDGVFQIGLSLARPQMDERIQLRVDQMWQQGFIAEVSNLERCGLRTGKTAARALGYRQILTFLAGECSESEAKEATVVGTRRFARKQINWFKRDSRIHWFDAFETEDAILSVLRANLVLT